MNSLYVCADPVNGGYYGFPTEQGQRSCPIVSLALLFLFKFKSCLLQEQLLHPALRRCAPLSAGRTGLALAPI